MSSSSEQAQEREKWGLANEYCAGWLRLYKRCIGWQQQLHKRCTGWERLHKWPVWHHLLHCCSGAVAVGSMVSVSSEPRMRLHASAASHGYATPTTWQLKLGYADMEWKIECTC